MSQNPLPLQSWSLLHLYAMQEIEDVTKKCSQKPYEQLSTYKLQPTRASCFETSTERMLAITSVINVSSSFL